MQEIHNDIFVQIPAYRDSELIPTVYDLIEKSTFPERLKIVVAWQYSRNEENQECLLRKWANLELIKIPAEESKGCNWARSIMQQKWNGEKYTLLLDSHHRFVQGWDEMLINMYEELKSKGSPHPIITGYLPTYDPLKDPEKRMKNVLKIHFQERKKGLLFLLKGKEITASDFMIEPFPAHFCSLHFLFAEGSFNKVLKFDPSIYFFADEIAIALRAYTLGYDLYHPHQILGWHLYNRSTRVPHWEDHPEWKRQNEVSYGRLFKLYNGEIWGDLGIGTQRNIVDYEHFIGMKLIDGYPYV